MKGNLSGNSPLGNVILNAKQSVTQYYQNMHIFWCKINYSRILYIFMQVEINYFSMYIYLWMWKNQIYIFMHVKNQVYIFINIINLSIQNNAYKTQLDLARFRLNNSLNNCFAHLIPFISVPIQLFRPFFFVFTIKTVNCLIFVYP